MNLDGWLSDETSCAGCDDGPPHRCSRQDVPRDEQCPENWAVYVCDEGPKGADGCPEWIVPIRQTIDWVIAGGESGPCARPWSIQWARSLRDECQSAGIPFFWKQHGEWAPAGIHPSETPGRFAYGDYEHDPGRMIVTERYPRQFIMFGARSVMERVGKKAAGATLDGREWREMPAPRTCRLCGCTDVDCSRCIERTGMACFWVEADLCSACQEHSN